ncbi:MAG: HEAT repeat domain-containing protein, partial [Planctomycetaceae bacterium]|nr:HEAT repeat domain-containing protein [Planctomycetaceae bacterium]
MASSFDLISQLDDPSSAVRARTALRLGWMHHPDATDAILSRLPEAVDEVCSYVDALGYLGDPQAIPVVREVASRKLLSRRRSGVEALYNLNDAEGLKTVHNRALTELPETVRNAVEQTDSSESIAEALNHIEDSKRLGHYLDTLYELADPIANQAIQQILDTRPFDHPFIWRYIKSLLKRSALRGDFVMFGWLAHRIERQGRKTKGRFAQVKSGYDGVQRHTPIFRKKTQKFTQRANWRHLRKIAHYQPELYPMAAAEALIPYTEDDTQVPVFRSGRFADCYLLHRILFDESDRFELDDRRLRFLFRSTQDTKPTPGVREEAYPELWDEFPHAYLRL